ncbi:MAG: hypothetical protein CMK74_04105 [Pseudomonadales bacterium]|nr:hypothetical protein [Pseudomonadales bacterium]|tara:strand:- start:30 stop:434 length:405 start_codon:yes stop_codon:yes gene_type:complete
MESENLFTRARNWLKSANPNLAQIASAYRGMQNRINTGSVEIVDDAEAVLDLLAESYENLGGDVTVLLAYQEQPKQPQTPVPCQSTPQLDSSPLVPIETTPVQKLSDDERRIILADLKRTIGSPSQGKFANATT